MVVAAVANDALIRSVKVTAVVPGEKEPVKDAE